MRRIVLVAIALVVVAKAAVRIGGRGGARQVPRHSKAFARPARAGGWSGPKFDRKEDDAYYDELFPLSSIPREGDESSSESTKGKWSKKPDVVVPPEFRYPRRCPRAPGDLRRYKCQFQINKTRADQEWEEDWGYEVLVPCRLKPGKPRKMWIPFWRFENADQEKVSLEQLLVSLAWAGDVEGLDMLLARGVDPKAKVGQGPSALHCAAFGGNPECVWRLMEAGADIESVTINGSTPLHVAAQKGHLEVVWLLLNSTANVNAADRNGLTPLHAAAQRNEVDCATLLLDHGADVDAKGGEHGHTPLIIASMLGARDTTKLLLNRQANVNLTLTSGDTALHGAASIGDLACMQLLLDRKANPNAANSAGQTPLHGAMENGFVGAASALVFASADILAADNNQTTPLALAKQQGHRSVIEFLERSLAEQRDQEHAAALHDEKPAAEDA